MFEWMILITDNHRKTVLLLRDIRVSSSDSTEVCWDIILFVTGVVKGGGDMKVPCWLESKF